MGKRADERSGATLDWLQLFFSANGGQRGGRDECKIGEGRQAGGWKIEKERG